MGHGRCFPDVEMTSDISLHLVGSFQPAIGEDGAYFAIHAFDPIGLDSFPPHHLVRYIKEEFDGLGGRVAVRRAFDQGIDPFDVPTSI